MESDPHPDSVSDSSSHFGFLGSDLTESILSYLPIISLIRASSVCKLWNSIINHSSSFQNQVSESRRLQPWLFVVGEDAVLAGKNRVFGFDPVSCDWIELTKNTFSFDESITASGSFFFSTCHGKFSFRHVFNGPWIQTRPLRYLRCNPLIGVDYEPESSKPACFLVVGGLPSFHSLADRENCLSLEIYDLCHDSWEVCPPLHEVFLPGNSSQSLCSAMFKGKFIVYHRYSGLISFFDKKTRSWSDPRTLRPPGMIVSFLNSGRDGLVLAGLCKIGNFSLEFNLWDVDETTLEFRELGIMPSELLPCLFPDRQQKYTTLKCVGLGNLVYVFREEHSMDSPICLCEIGESGKCSWRKIPRFPEFANNMRNIISSCCDVSTKKMYLLTLSLTPNTRL